MKDRVLEALLSERGCGLIETGFRVGGRELHSVIFQALLDLEKEGYIVREETSSGVRLYRRKTPIELVRDRNAI